MHSRAHSLDFLILYIVRRAHSCVWCSTVRHNENVMEKSSLKPTRSYPLWHNVVVVCAAVQMNFMSSTKPPLSALNLLAIVTLCDILKIFSTGPSTQRSTAKILKMLIYAIRTICECTSADRDITTRERAHPASARDLTKKERKEEVKRRRRCVELIFRWSRHTAELEVVQRENQPRQPKAKNT